MAKKDFSVLNTGRVYTAIEQATAPQEESVKRPQSETTAEEQQERAAGLRTQGRKGCKAQRINMAFTPENHEYIVRTARQQGLTMTQYINRLIDRQRLGEK